jgi:phage baseplate assembly protein W
VNLPTPEEMVNGLEEIVLALRRVMTERDDYKNALRRLCLGAQNSMMLKEDLGREAREALKKWEPRS